MDIRQQLQTTLADAYTIERELAGGGMSRVFVAVENALGRRIVVKVLPPETAASLSSERFRREIAVVARLQHPHIVPLLSAGETGGTPFYTMPFVKGESLRTCLSRDGELSVTNAVHVLRDVASALAHAHAEGIVHRDIKPDNVILSGGVAVVTDFGVYKAVDTSRTEGGDRSGITSWGVALGTPAYMSPEQASADPHLDHRSDIYSFGCLAYELLTGSSPFGGRPPQQMLAAQVNDAPESLRKRRPNLPTALVQLVMKCLEKRAADRPQSAEEILHTLDAIATPSGGMTPTDARWRAVSRRRTTLAVGIAVVGLSAVGVVYLITRQAPIVIAGDATRITSTADIELDASISPDGKLIAYAAGPVGDTRIVVRQIAGGRTVMLSGDLDGEHRWPRWSPEQTRIVFQAKGNLYVVPTLGGRLEEVARGAGSALVTPQWSPDGNRLAYADERGLWVRTLASGAVTQLVAGNTLHSPTWSPDGRRIAYVSGNQFYIVGSVSTFANLAPSALWIVPSAGGTPSVLTDSSYLQQSPVFMPDGRRLLYVSNAAGTRDVYQLNLKSEWSSDRDPHRITVGLQPYTISISADGKQIGYTVLQIRGNVWMATIGPDSAATAASARPLTSLNNAVEAVSLSDDGKWIAFDSDPAGNQDIYKLPVAGGEMAQLTQDKADDFSPRWSRDGREIAFHTFRNGSRDVYVMDAEGGSVQRVTDGRGQEYIPDWAPSGRQLCFSADIDGAYEVYVTTRENEQSWSEPRRLSNERGLRRQACRWSPDERQIAYVYGGKLVVMGADGSNPRILAESATNSDEIRASDWAPDGIGLYFHSAATGGRHSFWFVPVKGGRTRLIGRFTEPRHLTRRPDFATDGKRIVFVVTTDEADAWVMILR